MYLVRPHGANSSHFWAYSYQEKDGCIFDQCGNKICGDYGIEKHTYSCYAMYAIPFCDK